MEPNGELFDEIMAEVDAGLDLPAWPFHYRAFPYYVPCVKIIQKESEIEVAEWTLEI